jgi:hypothetical protein
MIANLRILLAIIVSLYLFQIAYYVFLHPYCNIPRTFLTSFSKLWINIRLSGGIWHSDILQIHQHYGSVVRIAPDEVSLVDGQALKTLYGHGTGTKKVKFEPERLGVRLFHRLPTSNGP